MPVSGPLDDRDINAAGMVQIPEPTTSSKVVKSGGPKSSQETKTTSRAMPKQEEEEEVVMEKEEWRAAMMALLDSTVSTGSVSTGHEIHMPGLHPKIVVDGLPPGEDRLAFPLTKHQALALIRSTVSEKAPFGKGRDTVLDETVRKAWQIDAKRVRFLDNHSHEWYLKLHEITRTCVEKLGLSDNQKCNVVPHLYKMLLYEKGGHFSKHRDTEKEPGMFGTMVIQLPSRHNGGGLVVHQINGETTKHDWSARSDDGFFATAFFADCEHELLEVTGGYRLCLVYNLVLRKTAARELPSSSGVLSANHELRKLVRSMKNITPCLDSMQGYLLDHKYTRTNLHFRNLKGRDMKVASLLQNAVDENGEKLFVVCLLLLEKWETGPSSGGYGRYGRYGCDDGETHGIEDVINSSISADHWIGPDDTLMEDFDISFDAGDNLLVDDPEDGVFGEDPDEEEFEGYTGNAGPTLEYWYWKSVLVFWPRTNHLAIAKRAGVELDDLRAVFGVSAAPKRSAVVSQDASKKQKPSEEVIELEEPRRAITRQRKSLLGVKMIR